VATALTFVEATTVGMDKFPVEEGIELTRGILAKLDLRGTAVIAESPGDVAAVCKKTFLVLWILSLLMPSISVMPL